MKFDLCQTGNNTLSTDQIQTSEPSWEPLLTPSPLTFLSPPPKLAPQTGPSGKQDSLVSLEMCCLDLHCAFQSQDLGPKCIFCLSLRSHFLWGTWLDLQQSPLFTSVTGGPFFLDSLHPCLLLPIAVLAQSFLTGH